MKNELRHHGIKGQRWHIRRGPPYPLSSEQKERTVLKKGSKLNSISLEPDSEKYRKRKRWMYTYNADDEWDSKVYKGPFSMYTSWLTNNHNEGENYVYEHQYETVEDLKMPTRKERIDEFIKLYKNDPLQTAMDLYEYQLTAPNLSEKAEQVDLRNLQTPEEYEAAYEILSREMEVGYAFTTTKKYSDIMSQKWDAMTDDNNKDIYNNVRDPIIIFRTEEALKKIGDVRMIDYEEMTKNYDEVRLELSKEGKRPLF